MTELWPMADINLTGNVADGVAVTLEMTASEIQALVMAIATIGLAVAGLVGAAALFRMLLGPGRKAPH